MAHYENGVLVPDNDTEAFAQGKFNNGQPNLFAKPLVQPASEQKPVPKEAQYNLERDHQGNYYVNGQKSPMKVFNPSAVPYKKDEQPIDPKSSTDGMDYINSLYTSPEDEKKMRRASIANQRILAVGDALRQIGNIYHTTQYAPSQKFNSPVMEENARYQQGKALRDAANMKYYSYQQAKAAQDRAIEKMERDFKLKEAKESRMEAYTDARISRMNAQAAKDGANKVYWETRARLLEEGWPLDKALKEARKAQIEAQTRLSTVKANQGGFAPRSGSGSGGAKYWAYDEDGNIHYYPNKSMYEQGVYEFSQGQSRSEYYDKGNDALGRPQRGERKNPVTSMGGERARQAREKKNANGKKANPMGNSGNGKK